MVLHHVAQRAGIVVIGNARFQSDGFGDGDLHVVDMRCVPQRLEHQVGEAQRQQVLDGLLAQIVIDAEDPVFGEGCGYRVVDDLARFQIDAERLFQADADILSGQSALLQSANGGFEQARGGREENREAFLGRTDLCGQGLETADIVGIERLVAQAI